MTKHPHEYRVYLATILAEPRRAGFHELGSEPVHFSKILIGPRSLPGHPTIFTARAEEATCIVEWVDETSSPFAEAQRLARLAHGDMFEAGGGGQLVYVERWGQSLGRGADLGSGGPEHLTPSQFEAEDLDSALRRFVQLPYVARAIAHDFVDRTGFVQYRDGREPWVVQVDCDLEASPPQLRMTVAVRDLFTWNWMEPTTTLKYALSRNDLAAIVDCERRLSAIPPLQPGGSTESGPSS